MTANIEALTTNQTDLLQRPTPPPIQVDASVNVDTSHSVPSPMVFERDWPLVWPLVLLVLGSLLIRVTNFDLLVARVFYDPAQNKWPYEVAEPWLSIYRHGTIPSILVGIAGGIIALWGKSILPRFGCSDSPSARRAGLFLIVMLIVGPGLIINVGFKELWGRPRPLQCTVFGGEKLFVPVGNWGTARTSNSSFPSGHAAVAFYLMAPGFIAGTNRLRLKRASFLLGALYGSGMGLTRIVQGGHFVSDVLWAGAFVYLTGVVLAWLILRNENS